MSRISHYLLTFVVFFSAVISANAQVQESSWPSPEVQDMYKQGREYLMAGNFQQAIITFQQGIQLAPNQLLFYRDLGKAYYLAGDYKNAQATLEPILKSEQADDISFQTMAACQAAEGEKKKAKNTLQKGLERFPNSGILYHDLGKVYEADNELVYALQTWLDGIHKDPSYHVNYYEAARMYMDTKKVVWAIIYGEVFVNLERQTPRSDEVRGMLFDAYKQLYTTMPLTTVPKFGKHKVEENKDNSFEEAVRSTYMRLAPVVADGVTVENLTMLRTRFIMDWELRYAQKYPFSLFYYQDELLRSGNFDIYNEWLFGKIDNEQEFEAWKKFHPEAIPQYEAWASQHHLEPVAGDFYNDMKVDDIFSKKKK
ncbi:MAG: tetratricopeptide repeat protein [Flavipsychrobacter sp.]